MSSIINEELIKSSLDADNEIKIGGAANPVFANAINVHNKKKKEIEKTLKDAGKVAELKKPFMGIKGKEPIMPKSKEMKKMHLSESLFEDYNDCPDVYDEIFRVVGNMEHIINYISDLEDEDMTFDDMLQSCNVLEDALDEFKGYLEEIEKAERTSKHEGLNESKENNESKTITESIDDVKKIKQCIQSWVTGKDDASGQNSAYFAKWLAESETGLDWEKIAEVAYLMGYDVYKSSYGYFGDEDYLIVYPGCSPDIYASDLDDENQELWANEMKNDLVKVESFNGKSINESPVAEPQTRADWIKLDKKLNKDIWSSIYNELNGELKGIDAKFRKLKRKPSERYSEDQISTQGEIINIQAKSEDEFAFAKEVADTYGVKYDIQHRTGRHYEDAPYVFKIYTNRPVDNDINESIKKNTKQLKEAKSSKTVTLDNFNDKYVNNPEFLAAVTKILGPDETYGGSIKKIKDFAITVTVDVGTDMTAGSYGCKFKALVDGDFDSDYATEQWIDFDFTNEDNLVYQCWWEKYDGEDEYYPYCDVLTMYRRDTSSEIIDAYLQVDGEAIMYMMEPIETALYDYVPSPDDMDESIKKSAKKVNAKQLKEAFYRGANGIEFVGHGEWADPELIYNGYSFNYLDIEDALWNDFLEETGYKDSQSNDPKVEAEFNKYVQDRATDYLDDCIFGGAGTPIDESLKESNIEHKYIMPLKDKVLHCYSVADLEEQGADLSQLSDKDIDRILEGTIYDSDIEKMFGGISFVDDDFGIVDNRKAPYRKSNTQRYNDKMDKVWDNSNKSLGEDLKIVRESDLTDFEFWSGARDTVKYLTDDEIRTIAQYLEDTAPEGMTDTEVNDFFWFEDDLIAEWLGYGSFEEIMERDNDEE